jgi:hypothetical protein
MTKIIKNDVRLNDLYLTHIPNIFSDVKIHGDFYCSHNQLVNLDGIPEYIDGDFFCIGNTKQFTENDVRSRSIVFGQVVLSLGDYMRWLTLSDSLLNCENNQPKLRSK